MKSLFWDGCHGPNIGLKKLQHSHEDPTCNNVDRFSEKIVKSPWFMYSYIYSMTSLLGVAVLLVCTPLGLARIFSVIGAIVMKPQVPAPLSKLSKLSKLCALLPSINE
jgi:hypothetical protein